MKLTGVSYLGSGSVGREFVWRLPSREFSRRRRASIVMVTAFSMVALLICAGIAINYSLLVNDANRVQRACDAAALAAAQDLGKTLRVVNGVNVANLELARYTAYTVAAQNGVTLAANEITFNSDSTRVTVTNTFNRSYFIRGVMGRSSSPVTRSATAGVLPAGGLSTAEGLAPIGITWETYNAYRGLTDATGNLIPREITLIRQNKTTFARNVGDVDMDPAVLFDLRDGNNGKSGAHMQDQLVGNSTVDTVIGEYQNTLNASLSSEGKKLEDGLETLMERAKASPWNDYATRTVPNVAALSGTIDRSNPRVFNIIVTPSTTRPNNGTFNTQIQGFAPVYLLDTYDEDVVVGIDNKGRPVTETVKQMLLVFLPPETLSNENGVGGAPNGTATSGVNTISLLS